MSMAGYRINEIEAYDRELSMADYFDLSDAEYKELEDNLKALYLSKLNGGVIDYIYPDFLDAASDIHHGGMSPNYTLPSDPCLVNPLDPSCSTYD